ncbi:MAG: dTDP-4-dehydrorhamnose reductase [Deltaproteobacteria bacterium]|nr:dTDP-4-dehydrorhamnose reductase [Deltaproteobacteria bacterium]
MLVLGARGMLGTDLMAALAREEIPARGADLPEVDVTDPDAMAAALGAGPVINCAAWTDVEAAEEHEERARQVNADAVAALGRQAAARGLYVLHVSTDFVFDGRAAPYAEDAVPNPLGAYGRSKLAGERGLAASGCRHAILRLQWTYGRAGRHFVSKVAALARTRDRIRVVNDQVGSATATTEAAAALVALLRARAEGLFHFAAGGAGSRFDVAQVVVDRLGLSCVVEPCGSDAFPSRVRRPPDSRFDCARIRGVLPGPVRGWREVLEEYLEDGP